MARWSYVLESSNNMPTCRSGIFKQRYGCGFSEWPSGPGCRPTPTTQTEWSVCVKGERGIKTFWKGSGLPIRWMGLAKECSMGIAWTDIQTIKPNFLVYSTTLTRYMDTITMRQTKTWKAHAESNRQNTLPCAVVSVKVNLPTHN